MSEFFFDNDSQVSISDEDGPEPSNRQEGS